MTNRALLDRTLARRLLDRGLASARAAFSREPGLSAVGGAGIVLALLCLLAVAARGRFIAPEGKMLDAATFTFGVGVFTLTMALLLPLVGYSRTARRRWRQAYYVFPVYGLALESLQAWRGLDPRFTEEGGQVDQITGAVFGLTALLVTVLFLLLGLRFFRSDVLPDRPALRIGIRYGVAAVTLSFGVGIVMSANAGRAIGEAGNLLLTHGLSVHGIQAIPVVALLVSSAGATPTATTWLHAAGIGWLAACTAALVQAVLGHSPLDASILTLVIVAGLTVWAAVAAHSVASWCRGLATVDLVR